MRERDISGCPPFDLNFIPTTLHLAADFQVCIANPPDDLTNSGCPVYPPGCDCDENADEETCPGCPIINIFAIKVKAS